MPDGDVDPAAIATITLETLARRLTGSVAGRPRYHLNARSP